MTTPSLEQIEVAHQKVADMIAAFKTGAAAQSVRTITIAHSEIVLQPGEHYAGLILGAGGAPDYHLVLLPGDVEDVNWEAAKEFAATAGGELPTRREQSLLFANLKDQFEGAWYWSSEQHAANDDFAWSQDFDYGGQNFIIKSAGLRARAVRRLTIQ